MSTVRIHAVWTETVTYGATVEVDHGEWLERGEEAVVDAIGELNSVDPEPLDFRSRFVDEATLVDESSDRVAWTPPGVGLGTDAQGRPDGRGA